LRSYSSLLVLKSLRNLMSNSSPDKLLQDLLFPFHLQAEAVRNLVMLLARLHGRDMILSVAVASAINIMKVQWR
jgi:hypothetical protein